MQECFEKQDIPMLQQVGTAFNSIFPAIAKIKKFRYHQQNTFHGSLGCINKVGKEEKNKKSSREFSKILQIYVQ